jgi:hypothetical protein
MLMLGVGVGWVVNKRATYRMLRSMLHAGIL